MEHASDAALVELTIVDDVHLAMVLNLSSLIFISQKFFPNEVVEIRLGPGQYDG